MVQIDENQEAIACIRMLFDIYDSEKAAICLQETANDGNELLKPIVERDHWKLGSWLKVMSVHEWEAVLYPFGKEPNQNKYLSAMVQSLKQYATQLFNNIGLVGRVHFDVTLCDR